MFLVLLECINEQIFRLLLSEALLCCSIYALTCMLTFLANYLLQLCRTNTNLIHNALYVSRFCNDCKIGTMFKYLPDSVVAYFIVRGFSSLQLWSDLDLMQISRFICWKQKPFGYLAIIKVLPVKCIHAEQTGSGWDRKDSGIRFLKFGDKGACGGYCESSRYLSDLSESTLYPLRHIGVWQSVTLSFFNYTWARM